MKIATLKGFVRSYINLSILPESALKKGSNVISIHCHQEVGDQYIDAGIVIESAG